MVVGKAENGRAVLGKHHFMFLFWHALPTLDLVDKAYTGCDAHTKQSFNRQIWW